MLGHFERLNVQIEHVPVGHDAQDAQAGDFILCHRKGFVSAVIRTGERLRQGGGSWSHAAYIEGPDTIIEALTHGVARNPLSIYRHIPYAIVRTHLDPLDAAQANAFAQSCVGQRYGASIIFGIILRYMTPGKGLWFGMNGTEICSGLVAQAEARGWANFPDNPATITPRGLESYYQQFVA